ncbi:MAG TPA: hypothetical protein VFR60_11160, partial [Sphingomicrobium sp.]|nr:hypothetical protein [Sphingomicrobium sp.]
VLARQVELGAKKREERKPIGRDGGQRLRFMGLRSGVKGLTMLPPWAVDPVRAANDADPPAELAEVAVDQGIPDDLRWLDSAITQLARANPVRGMVMRAEYCSGGTQAVKAARVAEAYGGELTLRQYRYELQLAKEWLRGRIAA